MPRSVPRGIIPRPKYNITSEVRTRVYELAKKGHSNEVIAGMLGISRETLEEKAKLDAQLGAMLRQGKAEALGMVENGILHNATREIVDKEGNKALGDVKAQSLFVSRRGGKEWRDEPPIAVVIPMPLFPKEYEKDGKAFLEGA